MTAPLIPAPASEAELLRCPFCGKPAMHRARRYLIGCKDLDCAGYAVWATPDEWNRRPPVAPVSPAPGYPQELRDLRATEKEYRRRLTEILELIEGREDIDNSGGPNVFMRIGQIAKGEDRP